MNSLRLFNNPQFGDIRAIEINNQPFFVGKDIADILGYADSDQAIRDHVESDDKLLVQLSDIQDPVKSIAPHMKGSKVMIISESGVYSLVFRSHLKNAKVFSKWVTSEVLPAIRKHGGYLTPEKIEEALSNPDFIIKLATALKTERANNERLQFTNQQQSIELKEAAPKVEYYNEVLSSKSDFTTTTIAKELGMTAQALNKILLREKIIFWMDDHYVLYADYDNKGYTSTRTGSYVDLNGNTKTAINTTWTEKGRKFIHDLIKSIETRQERRIA